MSKVWNVSNTTFWKSELKNIENILWRIVKWCDLDFWNLILSKRNFSRFSPTPKNATWSPKVCARCTFTFLMCPTAARRVEPTCSTRDTHRSTPAKFKPFDAENIHLVIGENLGRDCRLAKPDQYLLRENWEFLVKILHAAGYTFA